MTSRAARFATIALTFSACSASAPPESAVSPPGNPAPADATPVAIVGRAPITTSGIPAIVVLEPEAPLTFPAPDRVPMLDQISRTFVPSILFVRTGLPAEFHNSDTELHNINVKDASTRDQAFNVAVATDEKYVHTFERDGMYDVSCDVHAGMSAQIVVTSTPYVTIADKDGNFTLPRVVPGRYTATVYAGAQAVEHAVDARGPRTEVDLR
jgi:hypothetical protein